MIASVRADLQGELAALDDRIAAELNSEVPLLGQIGMDLISAGGKRIRPRMALLTARLLDAPADAGQTAALAVELLHTASLLHDDLIDESDTRRGQAAAHRLYGNSVSVMAGDFLLARVLRVLAVTDDASFTRLLADTAAVICEAEVRQYQLAESGESSLDEYIRVIDGKTGALFVAACHGVALLAGAPEAQADALHEFGLRYGRAFQMRDDYLDLLGDPQRLGKPAGNDLAEGKATLPVLLLLEAGVSEAADILERRAVQDGDRARMAELVRQHGAAARTEEAIDHELQLARDALQLFPASPARERMLEMAAGSSQRSA